MEITDDQLSFVFVFFFFPPFFGLAYLGKDIVLRFIRIEYSSLRDFYRPLGNNNRSIFIWGFLKYDILACVQTWD
jgi:hypothetical protein